MRDHSDAARDTSRREARLTSFAFMDFAATAKALARDPLGSTVLGFYASDPITWKALQSASRRTFWVDVNGVGRVGFIEVEALGSGSAATFSMYVTAQHRGNRYSLAAIEAVISWARTNLNVTELLTDTEDWNLPSIRAMIRSGFAPVDQLDGRTTFRRYL